MRVVVTGHSKHVARQELLRATTWMVDKVLARRDQNRLYLSVEHRRLKSHWADLTALIPGLYRIRISNVLRPVRQLTYLAHEIVHLRQHLDGVLPEKTVTAGGWSWGSWEDEAVELEKVIYEGYRVWRMGLEAEFQRRVLYGPPVY